MKPVQFYPEAFAELESAASFYDSRVPGLGKDFRKEVEAAVLRIQEAPLRWSPYTKHTGRFLVRRFPYLIVYLESSHYISVIAVAHGSRRPGYWHDRI